MWCTVLPCSQSKCHQTPPILIQYHFQAQYLPPPTVQHIQTQNGQDRRDGNLGFSNSRYHLQVHKEHLIAFFLLLGINSFSGQAQNEPIYLGQFSDTAHSVAGDIFVLDEKTIYIQDFVHDGQAPDVYFWADGVIIPYITRSVSSSLSSTD